MNKNIWPYQTRANGNSDDIYRWCQKTFYHGGYYEPDWYYNMDTNTWCFKRGKDYTMFCLRWS